METNSGVVALSANCSEKEVSTCINSQKEILWLVAGRGRISHTRRTPEVIATCTSPSRRSEKALSQSKLCTT